MIRTDAELRRTKELLRQGADHLSLKDKSLRDEGFSDDEVGRLLDPERAFRAQLVAEVEIYERLKSGDVSDLRDIDVSDLGRVLIGLRIASGLTQRELAERLGVHESLVSRDENNEYHGVSLERVTRILHALHRGLRVVPCEAPASDSRNLTAV